MTAYFQTVVVLTDQYPPDVLGGAELSLHAILKGMNYHDKKVVVIALSNRSSREFYDGIEVIRVPFRYDWPKFVYEPNRLLRAKSLLREAADAVAAHNTEFFSVAATALQVHKSHRSMLGAFPHIDQQALQFNEVLGPLRELITQLKPSLIHADNYKSIVLAHCLGLDIPVVSLVRDNRFFCAHRNQASNVAGEICVRCDQGCIEGKAPDDFLPRVKQVMESTLAFRLNALRSSSAVIATSRFLANQLQALGVRDVTIIRNPVERAEDVYAMQQGIERASPPEILCVGMLSHNKGQLQLVQALTQFREHLHDFKLVLAGRGALASRLEAIASELGLRDHLVITGFLDRGALYRSYARSSVVVCPNVWPEPFGRVPLEAAMSQRPVVAFDTGATREQIDTGATGWIVDAGDMDSLVERTVYLIKHPEISENMGREAFSRLTSKQQDVSHQLLAAWEAILQPN